MRRIILLLISICYLCSCSSSTTDDSVNNSQTTTEPTTETTEVTVTEEPAETEVAVTTAPTPANEIENVYVVKGEIDPYYEEHQDLYESVTIKDKIEVWVLKDLLPGMYLKYIERDEGEAFGISACDSEYASYSYCEQILKYIYRDYIDYEACEIESPDFPCYNEDNALYELNVDGKTYWIWEGRTALEEVGNLNIDEEWYDIYTQVDHKSINELAQLYGEQYNHMIVFR